MLNSYYVIKSKLKVLWAAVEVDIVIAAKGVIFSHSWHCSWTSRNASFVVQPYVTPLCMEHGTTY